MVAGKAVVVVLVQVVLVVVVVLHTVDLLAEVHLAGGLGYRCGVRQQ